MVHIRFGCSTSTFSLQSIHRTVEHILLNSNLSFLRERKGLFPCEMDLWIADISNHSQLHYSHGDPCNTYIFFTTIFHFFFFFNLILFIYLLWDWKLTIKKVLHYDWDPCNPVIPIISLQFKKKKKLFIIYFYFYYIIVELKS